MDATIKSCINCKHHHGRESIDDVSDRCYPCVWSEQNFGYYSNWEPILEEDERGWHGHDEMKFMKQDNVNPEHYKTGGIETIDYIRAKLGDEGVVHYCIGNVMKYTSRWQDKNGLEDLKKADWYLSYAIDVLESK